MVELEQTHILFRFTSIHNISNPQSMGEQEDTRYSKRGIYKKMTITLNHHCHYLIVILRWINSTPNREVQNFDVLYILCNFW